jgi:predicted O-methyltransferase YrrM
MLLLNINLALVKLLWLRIRLWINHLLKGKSKYYIHSPFVYDFCIQVLNNKIDKEVLRKINAIKFYYKSRNKKLTLQELGAGKSGTYTCDLYTYLKRTAITNRYGSILHRLVEHYQIQEIIETGTGLAISSAWLATAGNCPLVHSIEGNASLVQEAIEMTQHFKFNNINIHHGLVGNILPTLAQRIKEKTLIFLDAHHSGDATERYVDILLPHILEDTILVLDDINYSKSMHAAWKKLTLNERVSLSINLYRIGVIFFKPELSKQEFYLYH